MSKPLLENGTRVIFLQEKDQLCKREGNMRVPTAMKKGPFLGVNSRNFNIAKKISSSEILF